MTFSGKLNDILLPPWRLCVEWAVKPREVLRHFFAQSRSVLPFGFAILLGLVLVPQPPALLAQEGRIYGGDAGGTRYFTLKQLNKKNVMQLEVAWVYDTGDVSDGTEYPTRSAFEATPLVVDGVLYVTTPFCRLI